MGCIIILITSSLGAQTCTQVNKYKPNDINDYKSIIGNIIKESIALARVGRVLQQWVPNKDVNIKTEGEMLGSIFLLKTLQCDVVNYTGLR